MLVVGLTGSIGMGKSATAALFAAAGDAVHDADRAVHALYRGRAVAPVGAAFPDVIVDGTVDRARLGAAVFGDAEALRRLEGIVHPLVREDEAAFLARARDAGRRIAILDVPLLFETGRDRRLDAVVVATAPAAVQRARVLARPGMTEETFATITGKQMPDAEKRRRAHFIVDTGRGHEDAARQVAAIRRALLTMAG
jgi:dephospho-CoA kinase